MKKLLVIIKRVSFKITRKLHKTFKKDSIIWHNTYLQYIPDRYFFTEKYKKYTNFLSFSDLKKWTLNNSDNNICDLSRFFFLNLCIDSLLEENISADVAELGVYKGNSAFLLSKYAGRVHKKCYLFDTYEGFDTKDIKGLDKDVNKAMFDDTSLEGVKQFIGPNDHTVFVKGYFPDSLKGAGELSSFCLVHIDCDLEEPFTAALQYFYPKLVKGGYLIMHDYSSLQWPGAKNAIDRFFKDKQEFVIPVPDKSGTCVIRKV